MSAILGLRDVESLAVEARPNDYELLVHDFWKDARMFQSLLTKLQGRRKVTDPEFTVFEQDMPLRRAFVDGAVGGGTTTLVIDDGASAVGTANYFRAGQVLVLGTDPATGELLQVVSDPTLPNTIEVARAQFGSMGGAIANNTAITILHDASAEGGNVPTGVTEQPTSRLNYIGIIQTPWEYTEMMADTATRYGVREDQRQQKLGLWQHSFDIELSLLYGRRGWKVDPATGTRVRTTGGLAYWLSTTGINVWDGSGANFTPLHWYTTWFGSMTYGSTQVVLMAGSTLIAAIHALARATGIQMLEPYTNKFGFILERFKVGAKEVLIGEHKLLSRLFPGDGFVVDLPYLKYCIMKATQNKPVVVANNVLTNKGVYLTEHGLQFVNPNAFAHIKGVTVYTP